MVEHYDFIFVGRPGAAKETFSILREDYLKRLKRYVHVREHWVREQGVSKEYKDILGKSEEVDVLVVLDEKGKSLSSQKLAQRLESWRDEGRRRIAFVVGGADGLSKELKAKATWVLSLSELTLPHRLAHVVLLEQLYRAHTIIKGEPYHRE
ncbi:MAG: 23S rRNA (pseudouridine(1915)-N(3))-methyltransferase RlmH [Myxococcota bacterium]|jgi:23S rRNA (pseudouridine1915-N3)-methyltransferase|nr:23S rRNA (pseudouridine(1915)-N(3))-methyltransferase RlmH [Myxococcota bacterium]